MILHPHQRKENQCVMNHQQSVSISGKHHPENQRGEGAETPRPAMCASTTAEAGTLASYEETGFPLEFSPAKAGPGMSGENDLLTSSQDDGIGPGMSAGERTSFCAAAAIH